MTFFTDHTWSFPPKPALSGHSTSNSAISPTMPPIYTPVVLPTEEEDDQEHEEGEEEEDNDEVGEDDQEDEDGEEEEEEESDAEAETGHDSQFSSVQNLQAMAEDVNTSTHDHAGVEPTELMHHDLSEGIRFGSPDDGSNYLDSDFHKLAVRQAAENFESELQGYNPFSGYCLQLQAPGYKYLHTSILTFMHIHELLF